MILSSQVPPSSMAGFQRLHATCSSGLPIEQLLTAGSACVAANEGSSASGCTYPSATNFDRRAGRDDGSCTFAAGLPACPAGAYIDASAGDACTACAAGS